MDCDQTQGRQRARPQVTGGRLTPRDDLVEEIEALAALLAEVVELARGRALFPGSWDVIAELAMGHA